MAICSYGQYATDHQGHSYRATLQSDGSVACLHCGTAGPTTFEALLADALWVTDNGTRTPLLDVSAAITSKSLDGLSGLAARSNNGPIINRKRIIYRESNATATLTYADGAFEKPDVPDPDIGRDFDAQEWPGIPAVLQKIAMRLSTVGYRVTNRVDERYSKRTLVLQRGNRLSETSYVVDGPQVALSYIA